jgi:hypothetical protein
MQEFPGPQHRIRRVLDSALVGCSYVSSGPEGDGKTFVLRASRLDGRTVGVRFHGLRDGLPYDGRRPEAGGALTVRSVKRERVSLVSRLFPIFVPPGPTYARVRIDAGPATLEIVCQDAEWWEE